MFNRFFKNEKGFSMIEMLVVLVIIAVLVGGGIRFYQGYVENARVAKAKAQISTMQAALDAYYAEKGAYPSTNSELLNAGLKAGATEGVLETVDPWGGENKYKYSLDDKGKYEIRTGYGKVQGQVDTYVIGEGANGEATSPEVKTTS